MNGTLRPTAILTRRFFRTRSRALGRRLSAVAAALRQAFHAFVAGLRARFIVFGSLQDAAAKVAALQRQVDVAQAQVAAHRERERALGQSLQAADQTAAELIRAAQESAEEMLRRTQSTIGEIIQTARQAAAATLEEARGAAEETHRAARGWVDAALEEARARAQREVDAIGDRAAAGMEPLKAAADRLTEETHKAVRGMEARVEAAGAELSAKIAAFEAERNEYAQGLAALIERHAETLERVNRLQAEVQERLVPALSRLSVGLKSTDTSWLRARADKSGPARDKQAGATPASIRPGPSPAADGEPRRLPSRLSGEVAVRNVSSFRQATQLGQALGQLGAVETARLRAYASGEATFDVAIDHGSLAALDVRSLDGFSVEVVEVTRTRLVLQIGRRPHAFPPA